MHTRRYTRDNVEILMTITMSTMAISVTMSTMTIAVAHGLVTMRWGVFVTMSITVTTIMLIY